MWTFLLVLAGLTLTVSAACSVSAPVQLPESQHLAFRTAAEASTPRQAFSLSSGTSYRNFRARRQLLLNWTAHEHADDEKSAPDLFTSFFSRYGVGGDGRAGVYYPQIAALPGAFTFDPKEQQWEKQPECGQLSFNSNHAGKIYKDAW